MCDLNTLQQKIAELTNDGEVVIRFLAETVQGNTPSVQPCHRLEASRQLVQLGILNNHPTTNDRHSRQSGNPLAQSEESSSPSCPSMSNDPVRPEPVEVPFPSEGGNPAEQDEDKNPTHPVTYLDILNFNLAQLIRSETAEGHTIVEFLLHIMTGRDSAYTPNRLRIKPADRMAASREILRRGYGHFGRRRKLVDDAEEANDYDTLHTDLAKRMRQYSEQGSQAILFLLGVMKNDDPGEEYTARHRMSAAQELLRRGWDTNYDRIKQEHLTDYWQDQQDARLSVGQKKQLAGLRAFVDEYDIYDNTDYEPIAKELRERQDREADSNRHSRAGGNPAARGEGQSSPSCPSMSVPEPSETQDRPTENSELNTKNSPDPEQDCYYEPLSPEDQALFDYHTLIETGNYKEGEIQPRPVTEVQRLGYEATLNWMREVAESEGVPLLPNPLSGTLTRPKARSP